MKQKYPQRISHTSTNPIMNTQTPPIPRYCIIPTRHGSALIAIDTGLNPNEYPNPHSQIRFPESRPGEGVTLGLIPGKTCSIYHVQPGDIINAGLWNGSTMTRHCYEVLSDYTIRSHDPANTTRTSGLRPPVTLRNLGGEMLTVEEEDLEFLFFTEWPQWLGQILDAQLGHWQVHHVERYFQYTPRKPNQTDIWRCIRASPYQAVRRYQKILYRDQEDVCLKNCPRAQATFSLSRLFLMTRPEAIRQYPEELIRYAAGGLTDSELIGISSRKPDIILRFFYDMPARQRTVALNAALGWRVDLSSPPEILIRRLLMNSIVDYPESWTSEFRGEFHPVFEIWRDEIGFIPSGAEIMQTLHRLDAPHKQALARAIALSI